MALRDVLSGEDTDARKAAEAAQHGRSITGFSGRHTEADPRFADRDAVFGGPAEPIRGAKVDPIEVQRVPLGGPIADVIAFDPMFRRRAPSDQVTIERQPFGMMEQELAYPKRPGFRRYWFNDKPGRIRRALRAGYAHVLDPDTHEHVSRITDRVDGRGQSSYLMEIPIEWYLQDMARQAAVLERRLGDIRSGKADPEHSEQRYVPQQGISITRSGSAGH
jgi:hypothetical protein